jgi:hypothetical protein
MTHDTKHGNTVVKNKKTLHMRYKRVEFTFDISQLSHCKNVIKDPLVA